ncbi:MAG: enoyl-CoA hydratase [Candidatus Lambdaproteobacteria bacterium]|nr:enoyl-CoA hydratase [Candidatus Lambdaproteobacteria bacterium]
MSSAPASHATTDPRSAPAGENPYVLAERGAGIGRLTLNRPERRNALSRPMLGALGAALEAMAADPEVGVVVIAARGPVFSAGHDLREIRGAEEPALCELFSLCTSVMESVRLLPKPVIAEVHGLASAAGCQLVASCDLAVASREAAFQTPGVKIGLFCSTPAVPLARAIPAKPALEMLLTGRPIPAEEAWRLGLVNRVVAPEALRAETEALAREILQYSRTTVALGKRAFFAQVAKEHGAAYTVAEAAMTENAQQPDAQEGIGAFLEKRQPKWQE